MSSNNEKQATWFAYIYEPNTKKKRIVPTNSIYQFDIDNYDAEKDKYCRKTDKVMNKDGTKTNCQVLILAETKKKLEEKIKRKRPHVPKLNQSAFDESSELKPENESQNAAKKRKTNREDCKKSSQDSNNSIVAAHIAQSKNKFQTTNNNKSSKSEPIDKKSDNDKLNSYKSDNNNLKINKVLVEKEAELKEYREKLKIAEKDGAYWKHKYEELINNKNYYLSEQTGNEILDVLSYVKCNLGDFSENTIKDSKKSNKSSEIKIGDKVSISPATYEDLMREKECGPFITSTSYAVWDVEDLADRVVRGQRNVTVKCLIPEKKSAVVGLFEKWLRKKEMPKTYIAEQLDRTKLNRYFNGAISAARKRIGYTVEHENNEKNRSRKKQIKDNEEDDVHEFEEDDNEKSVKDHESDENEYKKNANDESKEVDDKEEEEENNKSDEDDDRRSEDDENKNDDGGMMQSESETDI